MPNYMDRAQCACGIRGDIRRVSPLILEGGNSLDSIYEITHEGLTHLVRFTWIPNERKYKTSCLRQKNK